ncbi:MAG: endolytic transglycosylase MltG, partial [Bacteroidota bacterium]
MYIKKILLVIVFIGLLAGAAFSYMVYTAIFSPNTTFNNREAYVFITTNATFAEVTSALEPLLDDMDSFQKVAQKKGYTSNIKAGKYAILKGMNNNEIINTLRSHNIPVKVSFNNQETVADLAGRIAVQIEPDSISLLNAFTDSGFLGTNDFD